MRSDIYTKRCRVSPENNTRQRRLNWTCVYIGRRIGDIAMRFRSKREIGNSNKSPIGDAVKYEVSLKYRNIE